MSKQLTSVANVGGDNACASAVSRCGLIAILGKPNVGKSTLLNHILTKKLCATSRRPQTTRNQILGITTDGLQQAIYLDTPGMQVQGRGTLSNRLNTVACYALESADIAIFMLQHSQWDEHDKVVWQQIKQSELPTIVVINKIDQLAKEEIPECIAKVSQQLGGAEIFPITARSPRYVKRLQSFVGTLLPERCHLFPPDLQTNCDDSVIATEMIREKLMRQLGAELPYQTEIAIENIQAHKRKIHINAIIYVKVQGQKSIVIGHQGSRIKSIGSEARQDLERIFKKNVMLRLWVKVGRTNLTTTVH